MKQLMLWQEETPTDPWIGKRVLYHEKRQATVTKILASTNEWGTLYELQVDGEPFPFVAYEDEWKMLQETSSLPWVLSSSMQKKQDREQRTIATRKPHAKKE